MVLPKSHTVTMAASKVIGSLAV